MLAIHPIHRRMAELTLKSAVRPLTLAEPVELFQCLKVNAHIITELDNLKQLAFMAHEMGDMDWQMDICVKIEALEARLV
ncbi:hypothetical protein NST50_05165 [Paenibacillus sp. FSL E2-0202]|uniref:DUF7667 family protein n=1 Tax=Paenibacillus sp. FSL E2-0202 TaxID=2954505 RepID=UPI0030EC24F7